MSGPEHTHPVDRKIGPGHGELRRPITVLVVDPDADERRQLRQLLGTGHIRVEEAADGREALVKIFSVQPNVVIADARLPYIDGLQLCRLLRDDAATMSIRIIGVTTDPSPEHVRLFRQHGADAVFVKPVSNAELASAIRMSTGAPASGGVAVDVGASTGSVADVHASSRHQAKARLHERYVSTSPPEPPPHLRCPQCDGVLQYERSHIGGVSDRQPEQWDYFVCARHGAFQYRHRTRKLKPAS